jgi:hypothetical protein
MKVLKKIFFGFVAFFVFLLNTKTSAQQISIDRGVKVNGLWCFPLVTDTLQYLYLPDRAMLAADEKKQPQFSFIRYATSDIKAGASPDETITKADGGAVLHFLVTYDTDDKKVKDAAQGLKEILHNDEVKLRGPVVFKEGRYALISSILNPADGKPEKKLLAIGAAPVLEGSRIALSFEMDPQHSQLLLESFKMSTPDVSLVFDLTFAGLTDAYNAKLTVDWSEVQKNEKIGGGVKIYFVSADVEKVYEELRKTNAIKLESAGEDSRMEALVNTAYGKLTDMLFRRIEPEQLPANDAGGLSGLLNGLVGSNSSSSGGGFPFGAHFEYKVRDIKTSGYSVLNFNSRIGSDRHHYITFNIGDFYKKYGQSTDYFRTVSLNDDTAFLKRVIYVGVDGSLLPEFDKLINNITVTMRKTHSNGKASVSEVNITKASIADNKNISMQYAWEDDADKTSWLNYEYRAQYNFKGGKTYQANWVQQNTAMINLFVPYERRLVKIEGDAETLKSKNVRATTVRIEYPFFGDNKMIEMTVKPDEDLAQKIFDITLPAGQYAYKYTIRWRLKDGTEKIATGQNDTEILFIDLVPDK